MIYNLIKWIMIAMTFVATYSFDRLTFGFPCLSIVYPALILVDNMPKFVIIKIRSIFKRKAAT